MSDEPVFARVTLSKVGERARTLTIQIRVNGNEGSEELAEPADGVEVAQPLGLIARPVITTTVEALVLRIGDEFIALNLQDKGGAQVACDEGEAVMYSPKEPSCVARCRADGAMQLTPKAGQDLVLNGGTLKVARVTDATVAASAMAVWMGGVATFINTLAPGTLNPALPTDFGTISPLAGAPNVKA